MPLDPLNPTRRLATPGGMLGLGLLMALLLAALPERWTDPLRDAAAVALQPGQRAATALREHGDRAATWVRSHFRTAGRLAVAEAQLRQLEQQNERLAAELDALRVEAARRSADDQSKTAQAGDRDDGDRLLLARCVTARVLGRQARTFLARRQMLDVGSNAGIDPDALVVDATPLLDRGHDAELAPGQLVLAGRRVWGKVARLGRHTSTVRTMAEPDYRDLVAVGSPSGPQGLLEGTGEPLARVRLVAVTEPVSVGDPVYSSAGEGVVTSPLLCGRIVRLEQPVGAAHWEIWMQPSIGPREPQEVSVLRIEPNPSRTKTP